MPSLHMEIQKWLLESFIVVISNLVCSVGKSIVPVENKMVLAMIIF